MIAPILTLLFGLASVPVLDGDITVLLLTATLAVGMIKEIKGGENDNERYETYVG